MAALVARGDGRRRGRVRHQLRRHPPRRRRPADPEPLGRPRRARRAVPGRRRDAGRGVVGVNGGDDALASTTSTTCSASSASRSPSPPCSPPPTGAHLKALEIHRAGLGRRRAQVWPQVSCRPLTFSMTMVEPFTLNTNPVFAELMPARRRRAPRRLRRPGVAPAGPRAAGTDRPGLPPRWDTYEIMESTRPSRADRRAGCSTSPPSGGATPFDVAARPRRSTSPTSGPAGARPSLANDDVDGVDDAAARGPLHARALRRRRPRRPALRRRRCPPTCSATGCASGACSRSRRPSTSSPRCRPTCSASPTAAYLAAGRCADVVVFDPDTVAPGPVRRVRRLPRRRRAPHRRPARPGCATCSSTASR